MEQANLGMVACILLKRKNLGGHMRGMVVWEVSLASLFEVSRIWTDIIEQGIPCSTLKHHAKWKRPGRRAMQTRVLFIGHSCTGKIIWAQKLVTRAVCGGRSWSPREAQSVCLIMELFYMMILLMSTWPYTFDQTWSVIYTKSYRYYCGL